MAKRKIIDRVVLNRVGAIPWKARDVLRRADDGSTELVRAAIIDAEGNEVVLDVFNERERDRIVNAVNFAKSAAGDLDPGECYLDPFSILLDAADILPTVLSERERDIGEKDEVLRDLVKRIKAIVKKGRR